MVSTRYLIRKYDVGEDTQCGRVRPSQHKIIKATR